MRPGRGQRQPGDQQGDDHALDLGIGRQHGRRRRDGVGGGAQEPAVQGQGRVGDDLHARDVERRGFPIGRNQAQIAHPALPARMRADRGDDGLRTAIEPDGERQDVALPGVLGPGEAEAGLLGRDVGGDADHHEIKRVRLSVDGRRCQARPRVRRRVVMVYAEQRKGMAQIPQRQQPKAQGEHAPDGSLQDQEHRFTSSADHDAHPFIPTGT
ncbi:MAG: hypothetical protein MI924_38200 [Chloroflexales bacterium]|nr:hypothetical protein [Chloroflexales bacterium]